MAQTPATSAFCYAAAADLFARYDLRNIADYVADDGSRATGTVPNVITLASNTNVLTALADASGLLEQACFVGERYTSADLLAMLNAATPSAGSSLIRRIVCDLAMGLIILRRPAKNAPLPVQYTEAQRQLQLLSQGEAIFPFLETAAAGVLEERVETARDVYARQGVTTQAARLFGRRADRSDPARQ